MEQNALSPIFTAHLFSVLDRHLIDLLRSLTREDWERRTGVAHWSVKDIAGHLLDTALRRLSIARDGYVQHIQKPASETELINLVNSLNHQGVEFFRRMSPQLLTTLMDIATGELSSYFLKLDPFEKAPLAVSWAGERESFNWFDIAREYTERWHHQQQIRMAVDRPGIMDRELYHPVIASFMRSLPVAYRSMDRPQSSCVNVTVSGDAGGEWYLYKNADSWHLIEEPCGNTIASVVIPEAIAWRIFTKGISKAEAQPLLQVKGDREMALHVLNSLAIVG